MESSKISKEISDFYEKYFIEIKLDCCAYYLVWGTDWIDNDADKILTNNDDEILLFKTTQDAIQCILTHSAALFDETASVKWAEFCLDYGPNISYLYDFDRLLDWLENDRFISKPDNKRDDYLYVINFINLIGDYAYQTNNQTLLAIHKGECIRSFFDYAYDNYFWAIPQNEFIFRRESVMKNVDYLSFKYDMLDLIRRFKARLVIYSYS